MTKPPKAEKIKASEQVPNQRSERERKGKHDGEDETRVMLGKTRGRSSSGLSIVYQRAFDIFNVSILLLPNTLKVFEG